MQAVDERNGLDYDPEESLLGSMLRWNQAIGDVVQIVGTHEYFRSDAHQTIFRILVALYLGGEPADAVTLADELQRQGQVENVGGYPKVGRLLDSAGTGANAAYYARIVRDKGILRMLANAGQSITHDATNPEDTADAVLESAERKIFSVAQIGVTGNACSLSAAVDEAYERLDRRTEGRRNGNHDAPRTGWLDLDRILCGLQDSELIVIAARPSVGKTAMGLGMARNVAVDQGLPVFFASLEQSRHELTDRLLCAEASVDSHRMRSGMLTHEDVDAITEAGPKLKAAPMYIDDSAAQSVLRIAGNARRLKLKYGIRAVVIDYLQLIDPDNKKEPRQEQVAGISRRLKHLARELATPVVALAQLNRQVEQGNRRPRLSDLRESGSIEADADTVLLLHRSEEHDGVIEVIVAKQRNGPTGEITLRFTKQFMRFENFAPSFSGEYL